MGRAFKTRLRTLINYFVQRLGESSTVQGFCAIGTLATGYTVNPDKLLHWVAAAGVVSAVLKILLPDSITKTKVDK